MAAGKVPCCVGCVKQDKSVAIMVNRRICPLRLPKAVIFVLGLCDLRLGTVFYLAMARPLNKL